MATALILNRLIEKLGLTINGFEEAIGASNGAIRKAVERDSKITANLIEKILRSYAYVNRHWLETGEGEMLLKEAETNTNTGSPPQAIKNSAEPVGVLPEDFREWMDRLTRAAENSATAAMHSAAATDRAMAMLDRERKGSRNAPLTGDAFVQMLEELPAMRDAFQDAVLVGLRELGYQDAEELAIKAHKGEKVAVK